MLKRPTVFLALLGIIAVVLLVLRLRQSGPAPEPLVPPPQSPYAQSIGARGIVESTNENVRIAPSASGLVGKVAVRVGDHVKSGDLLFTMDDRDAAATVKTSEAQVEVQKARLAETATLVADRKDTLDRTTQLRAKNVASFDQAQRDEFALQSAQRQYERAAADLDLARAQLNDAKVRLDLLSVRSPRDGTVLQVNIRAGEYAAVNSAEPAILLGDVSTLQLRADVDESDAPRVRPGCKAVAYLKGSREKAIPLEFVRIEPYILPKKSLSGESTERVDTRVLQVIFRFQSPGFPIYVGQQMDVFIEEN
ncbi:MAG: efflux RND transporter periplasmic adaptor subunit [Verrucomicrobiaceae bacterium]|nr:MAG: efflux RND transporter periplasmic adaptor subunit [Verrucomicrobiaceae bacterium]